MIVAWWHYISIRYLWDVKVDQRLRSKGQRSRSYWRLWEKIVLTITHERIDGSCWNFLWGSVLLRVKALHQIYCVVTRPSAAYNARTHQVLFAYKSWTDGRILMILTYIIDIDEKLKLTQGQAFMWRNSLDYNSRTYWWILIILTYIIDIDGTLKLTQGQGHKVKDQGHIGMFVRKNSLGYNSWTYGWI